MAKKNFVNKEAKRGEKGLEMLEVEFVKDMKHLKKGTKSKFGIDTAVDLILKGYAKAADAKGKRVMEEINAEDEKHKAKAAETKQASEGK